MTELTSSRLGAGLEITLISSERRRVPEILGVAIVRGRDSGIVTGVEGSQ